MMNKYIEAEMTPTFCGVGGSFSVEASSRLDNFKRHFMIGGVKISASVKRQGKVYFLPALLKIPRT